jgi:tetratricopeptide (TPR) repeat protein
MAAPFPARSFLGTMGMVFISMGAIFAVDMFLANLERVESRAQAVRLFREGRNLMARGDNAGAIERIGDAISLARGNREYLRTLAQAQLAAGKIADAESTVTDLLNTDSTDGLASLTMARALEKQGRYVEAISYFHRAVYGQWSQDAAGNQLRARFELIDLLAARNSKDELLAELLPIQDKPPHDLQERARLGRLFLQAGSPARAAGLFRGVLRDAPSDADAYAGLGEAEFAQSQYRQAQRDFEAALRLNANNQEARKGLDLCGSLLALDPTLRGLSGQERFERGLKLLGLTRSDAASCAGANPDADLQQLLDAAAKALNARVSEAKRADAAESDLDAAERLWQARLKECKAPPAADTPLALVLARISQ